MKGSKSHRITPAFVLAAIALFMSLGGAGYAASKRSSPLSKKQIQKLIAKYVKAHKHMLTGPQGPRGPAGVNGNKGDTGAQGPGAIKIGATITSASSGEQPAGSAGPWTFTLKCQGGGPATFTIHGPGKVGGTATLGGSPATTYVGGMGPIGAGAAAAIGNNGNMAIDNQLQSGSTLYEVKALVSASNGGVFENCSAVGEVIPVS